MEYDEGGSKGDDHIYAHVKVDGYKIEREHIPASFTVFGDKVECFSASGNVPVYTWKYRYTGFLLMYYSKDTGLNVYLSV